MKELQFDNRFVRELPADAERSLQVRQVVGATHAFVTPTPVAAPRLLAWSPEAAALLDWTADDIADPRFAAVFAGNALLPGMEPYAAVYGGHQFGQWAGQLGDGRAITLGEALNARGERWELQLKGAGLTPFSRHADGRAVLRSSLREYLCSEAMFHLGVPTTRALSLVASGEGVMRDMFYDGRPQLEPGAVVCRMAPSFLRFGNYQILAARGDVALLARLADFTIARDFPELLAEGAAPAAAAVRAAWFRTVCERTAQMVAHWMRVGFVHGVMNTDNMSILGLTIDYGPYGWIDNFDLDWTPNTTDAANRRYRFGNQPGIAHWNLLQLAQALYPLFDDEAPLQAGLDAYVATYETDTRTHLCAKLGLRSFDDAAATLCERLYGLLAQGEIDMTLFFRRLAHWPLSEPTAAMSTPFAAFFAAACYDTTRAQQVDAEFTAWLRGYAALARQQGVSDDAVRRAGMDAVNPLYVPRNYLAQQAIDAAHAGDLGELEMLFDTLRTPYVEQAGRERFAARRPDWARQKAGCSMLSCSS